MQRNMIVDGEQSSSGRFAAPRAVSFTSSEKGQAPSPRPSRQLHRTTTNESALRRGPIAGQDHSASPSKPDHHSVAAEMDPSRCGTAIVGALRDVVRSVIEERHGHGVNSTYNQRRREADSTLREGVRHWLMTVEQGVLQEKDTASP